VELRHHGEAIGQAFVQGLAELSGSRQARIFEKRSCLMNLLKSHWRFCGVTVLLLGAALSVGAQKQDRAVNQKERNLALGAEEVKQLLLLMDTDKSGKVSRQEYMNFMAAEFDRLDRDKSGELDVKELAQSQLRVSHPAIGK
jgi:hypothetical protein